MKEDVIVLLDRDKGGREAIRYIFYEFISNIIVNSLFSNTFDDESIAGCSFHISQNVQKRYGKDAAVSFMQCSQARTPDSFYQQLANFANE